jgi:hypothetical protein
MSENSLSDASISCSICLSNSNDDLVSLPCDHHYHRECISKNYTFEITRNNKTYYECPDCRRKISMDIMSNVLYDNISRIASNQVVAQIENSSLINHQQMSLYKQNKKCIIGILCICFFMIIISCVTFFIRSK